MRLITFEGGEGSGKTSVIKYVKNTIEKILIDSVKLKIFKRPGGTEECDAIRQVLLDPKFEFDPITNELLFIAEQKQFEMEVLNKEKNTPNVIFCDRFDGSNYAYSYACGILDTAIRLRDMLIQKFCPDITFYFHFKDPEIGLSRKANKNKIDNFPIEFHMNVNEGFKMWLMYEQAITKREIVIVDASLPESFIKNEILKRILLELLKWEKITKEKYEEVIKTII